MLVKSTLAWAKLLESTQISLEIAKLIEHSDELEFLVKDYLRGNSEVSLGETIENDESKLKELVYPVLRLQKSAEFKLHKEDEEEEMELYNEINKEWKCYII